MLNFKNHSLWAIVEAIISTLRSVIRTAENVFDMSLHALNGRCSGEARKADKNHHPKL